MQKTHLAIYAALFAVLSVASVLVGCGGTETTPDECGPCTAQPACCSTSGGIQTGGVIVPVCCEKCPSGSTLAGTDNVTAGGPYLICSCDGC